MTTFYYDINKVIDKIDTAVLLKARNINKDASADFAQLSITDAKGFVKDKLAEISVKIFDKISSPLSRQITGDRFVFDETVEGEPGRIGFFVELPQKFDQGTTTSILRAIEDVMVSFCIYEWLYHANYDSRKEEERFNQKWDDLLSLITRRVNLKRTYKLY